MADRRPLWPARLHHLGLVSANAGALAGFYQRVLGYDAEELSESRWRLRGKERELIVTQGAEAGLGFAAFAVDDAARLAALRADIEAKGAEIGPSPSPLLGEGAFAVEDPDGNTLVFGLPREARAGGGDGGLPSPKRPALRTTSGGGSSSFAQAGAPPDGRKATIR